MGIKGIETKTKKVIRYCRVSSHKQKDDLARQIENVTVFSCRLQGKRANKASILIKELLENDTGKES